MRHGTYDKLNEKGFAPEETVLENGDILMGKVSPIQPVGNSNKVFKDSSEYYKSHVSGVVDKVYTDIYNNEGYEMRKVRIRSERIPIVGDKFCILGDVDVLTNRGWIKMSEITMDYEIATLIDNNIRYVAPTDVYSWNYTGQMYKLRSRHVDIDCTIDHELFVKKEDSDEFELLSASDVYGKKVKFRKWAENDNSDMKNLEIKGTSNELDVVKYLENDNDIWHLSEHQSRMLLNKLMPNSDTYHTESEKLANNITQLAIHAGWSGTIGTTSTKFIITINKSNNEPGINKCAGEIYDYDGEVYCLEVPSHVFMIRQNGKNVWIGNCSRHAQKGTCGLQLSHSDMMFTASGMMPDLVLNPNAIEF